MFVNYIIIGVNNIRILSWGTKSVSIKSNAQCIRTNVKVVFNSVLVEAISGLTSMATYYLRVLSSLEAY
jgi:hypothetical protein